MGHVYFIRHGESSWNVEDRICGATDVPLTEKGHEIKDFPILWLGDATNAAKTLQVYAFWQVYYNSSQALSRLHDNKVSTWFGDGHAALHSKEEINKIGIARVL